MWLDSINIDFRQAVEAMTVVTIKWEWLELFKQPAKSLSGRPPIIWELESAATGGLDFMDRIIPCAESIHDASVDGGLFRKSFDGGTSQIEFAFSGIFDTHLLA
jgi:hypothetical protein